MEFLNHTAILSFNHNQLQKVREDIGFKDVIKLKNMIDEFEDWIQKQRHFGVKHFERSYLERYLLANKGDIERAKKRLDRLYTLRSTMPHFLRDIDMMREVDNIFQPCYFCILPKPDSENRRIILIGIKENGVDANFQLIMLYRFLFGLFEYLLRYDYSAGYQILIDSRNLRLGLVMKVNPIIVHKGLNVTMEGFAARICGIHFISGSWFLQALLAILKQTLTRKLNNRIRVHSCNETLYEVFPKESLPTDLGGYERSIEEISGLMIRELTSDDHTEYLNICNHRRCI